MAKHNEITQAELERATAKMEARRETARVRHARFDRAEGRVILDFANGVQFRFEAAHAQGLNAAKADDLVEIEVSPSGLSLYWPRLDVDLDVQALLQGVFGSKQWMAARLGQAGGRATSEAKSAAAKKNGMRGGRPIKALV